MLSFDRIQQLAAIYPGVEASTSYGTPALKVAKKLILRMHQKEDAIVMLLNSVDEQQALIAEDPMAFYITDHYAGYPAVLVRPTVEEATFKRLLEQSWRRVARKQDLAAYHGD
ncbi:MAG: MmcQ/YjbR family DNA-binding protein [Pseudomonadota bacterium]